MTYQTMTKQRWLQTVADHAGALRQLVGDYHPATQRERPYPVGPITAPGAEAACENVRDRIRKEESGDPMARWDKALASGDVGELNTLLSGAWFGVPESAGCWNIPGFSIACDLMDDPPEDDGGVE